MTYTPYGAEQFNVKTGAALIDSGPLAILTAEFTRPSDTTAYAANDVVSNSASATTPLTIAGCARFNGRGGIIAGIRISTNLKSIVPALRVHLFRAVPTVVSGDNLPFREVYADAAARVGYYDMPAMLTASDTANSDMSRALDFTAIMPFQCAVGDAALYVVLETLTAFTPASGQKFTVALHISQD